MLHNQLLKHTVLLILFSHTILYAITAPSQLVLNTQTHSVSLSWHDNANDETSYKVFRDGNLVALLPSDTQQYQDIQLTAHTRYHYTVKASDDIADINLLTSNNTQTDLVLNMKGNFLEGSHISFFIDADNNTNSGYISAPVLGAEYLVQDENLYRYTGQQVGKWSWELISQDIVSQKDKHTMTSTIPIDQLQLSTTINFIAGISTSDWSKNIKYQNMQTAILQQQDSHYIGARDIPSTPIEKGTLFASVEGAGDVCTQNSPCDIYTAFSKLQAGDTLFLKGGVYHLTQTLVIPKSGTEDAPITIESFPGENAVLDGGASIEAIKNDDANIVYIGLQIGSVKNYIHIRKLEIRKMAGSGIFLTWSSYNTIEGCHIHDNYHTGILIRAARDSSIDKKKDPADINNYYYYPNDTSHGFNVIQDNTIYNNSDIGLGTMENGLYRYSFTYKNGNNADGISVPAGRHNLIAHNTVHDNSDDGIDVWRSNDSEI